LWTNLTLGGGLINVFRTDDGQTDSEIDTEIDLCQMFKKML